MAKKRQRPTRVEEKCERTKDEKSAKGKRKNERRGEEHENRDEESKIPPLPDADIYLICADPKTWVCIFRDLWVRRCQAIGYRRYHSIDSRIDMPSRTSDYPSPPSCHQRWGSFASSSASACQPTARFRALFKRTNQPGEL